MFYLCSMSQQQQQGQFIGQGFPTFPPFPNNIISYTGQNTNYYQPYLNRTSAENQKNSFEQHPPRAFHYDREEGEKRVSYERNRHQEQYASYPRDAIYRRASGPGWQQQQVFYPARSYK